MRRLRVLGVSDLVVAQVLFIPRTQPRMSSDLASSHRIGVRTPYSCDYLLDTGQG